MNIVDLHYLRGCIKFAFVINKYLVVLGLDFETFNNSMKINAFLVSEEAV